jgi:protein-disulfide isomerase
MAVESDWVHAEVVEAAEFEELANRFNVMGVPLNIINGGKGRVEGAAPPPMMVNAIKAAMA